MPRSSFSLQRRQWFINFSLSNFIRFSTGCTRTAASSLNLRHFLRSRTSLFMQGSYFIRIVYLWNDLPLSIRQTPSITLFKPGYMSTTLKNWIVTLKPIELELGKLFALTVVQ